MTRPVWSDAQMEHARLMLEHAERMKAESERANAPTPSSTGPEEGPETNHPQSTTLAAKR